MLTTLKFNFVRLEILKAMSIKMAVSWNIAPCSLIDTDGSFRGLYCLHHQSDSSSETSVSSYHITQCYIREDSHHH
jgi:hypothetical protein